MSMMSEETVVAIVDFGDGADAAVRRAGAAMKSGPPTGLARALGWFSVALGAAEALMPRPMARLIGAEGYAGVVFAFGLREIATGLGILMEREPSSGWLWARTWGDGLDLAFLGMAAISNSDKLPRAAWAAAAVAG